jgi:hypothetical protein
MFNSPPINSTEAESSERGSRHSADCGSDREARECRCRSAPADQFFSHDEMRTIDSLLDHGRVPPVVLAVIVAPVLIDLRPTTVGAQDTVLPFVLSARAPVMRDKTVPTRYVRHVERIRHDRRERHDRQGRVIVDW